MKNKPILVISLIALIVIVVILVGYFIFGIGKYTYLSGTVTAYDTTPVQTDGSSIFEINKTPVYIGGFWDLGVDRGEFDSSIRLGDAVVAKLIRDKSGTLTYLNCPECYIKKVD